MSTKKTILLDKVQASAMTTMHIDRIVSIEVVPHDDVKGMRYAGRLSSFVVADGMVHVYFHHTGARGVVEGTQLVRVFREVEVDE